MIEKSLRDVIDEAIAKKVDYHRIDKDSKNFGRLFVYFQHADKGKKRKR